VPWNWKDSHSNPNHKPDLVIVGRFKSENLIYKLFEPQKTNIFVQIADGKSLEKEHHWKKKPLSVGHRI
jgi:hypothetical protein